MRHSVSKKRVVLALAGVGAAVVALAYAPRAEAAISGPDTTPEGLRPLTPKQRAQAVIARHDVNHFGGWFAKRDARNVVLSIFQIESGFNPKAVNLSDPFGGAHGIGQVLAEIAEIDYGVSRNDLYDLEIGALTAMRHMLRQFDDLAGRLGREPSRQEWVMAYNAGARGVAEGRKPLAYYARFLAAYAVNSTGFAQI